MSLIASYLHITVIPWMFIASNFPFYVDFCKKKKISGVAKELEIKLRCVYLSMLSEKHLRDLNFHKF